MLKTLIYVKLDVKHIQSKELVSKSRNEDVLQPLYTDIEECRERATLRGRVSGDLTVPFVYQNSEKGNQLSFG
jgi:hypothetical protein